MIPRQGASARSATGTGHASPSSGESQLWGVVHRPDLAGRTGRVFGRKSSSGGAKTKVGGPPNPFGLTAAYSFRLPDPLGTSPTNVGSLPDPIGITAAYSSGHPRVFGRSPTIVFADPNTLGRPPTFVGSHPKSVFLFGDNGLEKTGHFHAPDTYVKCHLCQMSLLPERRAAVAGAACSKATRTRINSADRGIARTLLPRPPRRNSGTSLVFPV